MVNVGREKARQETQRKKEELLKRALKRMRLQKDYLFEYANIQKYMRECASVAEQILVPNDTSTFSKNKTYREIIDLAKIESDLENTDALAECFFNSDGDGRMALRQCRLERDILMREKALLEDKNKIFEAIIKKYNATYLEEELGPVQILSESSDKWKIKAGELVKILIDIGAAVISRENNAQDYVLFINEAGYKARPLSQKELEELGFLCQK